MLPKFGAKIKKDQESMIRVHISFRSIEGVFSTWKMTSDAKNGYPDQVKKVKGAKIMWCCSKPS